MEEEAVEAEPVPLPTARTAPFDPPPELAQFREQEPLRRLAFPDGHVGWLVTSYTLAKAVLADERFSSRFDLRRSPVRHRAGGRPARKSVPKNAPKKTFLGMDRPEHTRVRRLLTGQFTVRSINLLRPRIEQLVDQHLSALEQAGPPADLVSAFAYPVASSVACELLGVPYADRAEFENASAIMLSLETTAEQVAAARDALTAFLAELIQRKRAEPSDDLLGRLIASGDLAEDDLLATANLLVIAGHEPIANMLAIGTFALLCHPEQAAALRAESVSVDNAVEELLRYLSVVHYAPQRAALEDIELAGTVIRAGETVHVSLPAANRDPERFTEPDTLDITRDARGHIAFGHGVHQCLGQQLARIEMRVGYPALFQRFPTLRLAIPPAEVPLRTNMITYGVHRLPVVWQEA